MTPLHEQARTLPPDLQALLVSKLPEERELNECGRCNACELAMICTALENSVTFNQARQETIQALPEVIKAYNEWLVNNIFFRIDIDMEPTIQDEAWGNQFDSKPEAFWYGQDQYRKEIIPLINNVTNYENN